MDLTQRSNSAADPAATLTVKATKIANKTRICKYRMNEET
jgi:hypothetical protein